MIIIILPAYNEEENIGLMFERLSLLFAKGRYKYQLVIVDDGSRDNTVSIISSYGSRLPVHLIKHETNMGLGFAIRSAMKKALEIGSDDDVIARLDADNSQDPEIIEAMAGEIEKGSDVVIGSRYVHGGAEVGVSLFRRLLSKMATLVLQTFFPIDNVTDYSCGFRAYRLSAIRKAFERFGDDFVETRGFAGTPGKLLKLRLLGVKMSEVPLPLRYDMKKGKSKMSIFKTINGYVCLLFKLWFCPLYRKK